MNAGELVREARVRAGLSLRELAKRAGTSHATLRRYETGEVSPSAATLERIVRAAGFDLNARLVTSADGPLREREIRDVLVLAAMFPARHSDTLAYPVFPGR
jgi:transcriptional regulator with XRE-family HTH domain